MHLHQLAIVCANLNQYEPVNMKSEDCGRKGVFRSFYAGSRFIKVCHLRSPQSMAMTSEISEPCRRQTASRWPMLAYILLYDRCILHHWSRLVGKKLRFDASLCVLFSLWGVNCFFNDKQMRRFVFQGSGWTSKLFNCANFGKEWQIPKHRLQRHVRNWDLGEMSNESDRICEFGGKRKQQLGCRG